VHGPALALSLLLLGAPVPAQEAAAEPVSLRVEVNGAIARGVVYLRSVQLPSGDFPDHGAEHPGGAAALVGYAWVKSGLRRRDPDLLRALEVVRTTEFRSTYSHSVRLLLLEALGQPAAWADEARASLAFLLEAESGGLWTYPWGEPDLSNTQLALLGLNAARGMGLEVDADVWRDATTSVWRFQQKGAGFSYRAGGQPTGGMTAATLGGLALLERVGREVSAVRGALRKRKRERAEAEEWMGAHLDFTRNHYGPRAWTSEWHYVYLWAIERWAGFAGLERIDGRDWYTEGARALVDEQRADGAFGPPHRLLQNTCYALLFLRRATVSTQGELDELYAELDRRLKERAPPLVPSADAPRRADWLLAGPWQGKRGNTILIEPPFDPSKARARDGGRVGGKKWRAATMKTDGWTDLQQLAGQSGEHQLWAVGAALANAEPLEAVLWLDLEDGWDVYLDGARVGFGQRVASRIDGLVRVELELDAGEHELLALVEQEGGAVPFGARFTDRAGRALGDALTVRSSR
jgi:hypothetical protein